MHLSLLPVSINGCYYSIKWCFLNGHTLLQPMQPLPTPHSHESHPLNLVYTGPPTILWHNIQSLWSPFPSFLPHFAICSGSSGCTTYGVLGVLQSCRPQPTYRVILDCGHAGNPLQTSSGVEADTVHKLRNPSQWSLCPTQFPSYYKLLFNHRHLVVQLTCQYIW